MEFNEGDQLLSLTVNANDSLYQEESNSDSEQDNISTETEESDQESDEKEGGSEDESDEPVMTTASGGHKLVHKSFKEKIQELDDEMKDRIINLHRRMSEQGMHGAAELLQECFDPPCENFEVDGEVSLRIPCQDVGAVCTERVKSVKCQKQSNKSKNQNATVKNLPVAVPSEETIYDKVVNKRSSSSSEEGRNLRYGVQYGAESIIKQAEAAKDKIFPPTGETNNFQLIVQIDQDYFGHLQDAIIVGN